LSRLHNEVRVTFRAIVRVDLQDGTFREAVGFGEGRGEDEHSARTTAIATAVADGEMRALQKLPGGEVASPASVALVLGDSKKIVPAEVKAGTEGRKGSLLGQAPVVAAERKGSVAPVVATERTGAVSVTRAKAQSEDGDSDDDAKVQSEKLAQAEARRLELRRQKEQEEEIERLRIEQEEEEERIRLEQEEEEERHREAEQQKKEQEDRKLIAEKKRIEEEEAAAASITAAPASVSPRASPSSPPGVKRAPSSEKLLVQTVESPSQTRKLAASPPPPAARPKALSAKTVAAPVKTASSAPVPTSQAVPAIVPRSAPVPTSTARGPVRSPVNATAPPLRGASASLTTSAAGASGGTERKQLSLSSRKNVKQFQPSFAQHVGRLTDTLGLSLQIQSKVEWTSLADVCDDSGFKNMCGEIFFEKVMGGLVGNLVKVSKAGREQLIESWTSGGIVLRFDESQDVQWTAVFSDDGDLELTSRGEPWQDVETVGSDLLERLGGGEEEPRKVGAVAANKTPLEQNVAEFSRAFSEHATAMQKVAELSALPSHNVNFEELNNHLKKLGKPDTAGELFLSTIVGSLARNVSALCQKRLVASVLRNLWGIGVISLTLNEQQKEPWNVQLLRGACVISVKPSALLSSSDTVGKHMLDLAVEGDSGLPVLSAQSMQDHDKEIQDLLERLRVAAGLPVAVVADIDFFEVTMLVNAIPGWEHQVGRAWVAILASLVAQMELVAVQPDALEILANLWGNAVLNLAFDDTLDEGMWQCDFVEGDLILYCNTRGIHMVSEILVVLFFLLLLKSCTKKRRNRLEKILLIGSSMQIDYRNKERKNKAKRINKKKIVQKT
jgi:hypothetical protein